MTNTTSRISSPQPNFLVIGAQKSGTTWLHRFLSSHPSIFMPANPKELHYFDNWKRFDELSFKDYLAYFEGAGEARRIGEATAGYLWCSPEYSEWGGVSEFRARTPERVRDKLGLDIKLIALLRNPIDRALSGFLHHKRKGRIPATAELHDFIRTPRFGLGHQGFYAAHVSRWSEVFPRQNLALATYDAVFSDTATRERLQKFLGVTPRSGDRFAQQKIYAGAGFVRDKDGVRESAGKWIATARDIQDLRSAYAPDVAALSERWGVNVSPWAPDFG